MHGRLVVKVFHKQFIRCPIIHLIIIIIIHTAIVSGILTILVKTIANTNNNTLAKSIADTNTNTFVTKPFNVFICTFSNVHFFLQSSINNVNKIIVVEKMAKSL